MKDLIIVCAGVFGRELLEVVKHVNRVTPKWNIKGFINDDLNALDGHMCSKDYPILGTIKDWIPSENEVFAVGIASPKGKRTVVETLKAKGAKFETVISPRAFVADYVTLGEGVIITAGSVQTEADIGDFVTVAGSVVGCGCSIDEYSTTTSMVNLTSAQIGKDVFIGSHSVVLENNKIGDGAFICAGSIVFNNISAGKKVWGIPAKKAPF